MIISILKQSLKSFFIALIIPVSLQAQWTEEQMILLNPASESGFLRNGRDSFGNSVATEGDFTVIGAPQSDLQGINAGLVFLYRLDGSDWVEEKVLFPSDGGVGDLFGWSVSISGTTIIVGAIAKSDNGESSGSVYIFEKDTGGTNNWGQVAKILPEDGSSFDEFGNSLSISGTTVIVGSSLDDDNGSATGSAYVFEKNEGGTNNWGQIAKLLPDDPEQGDRFGSSVSVFGTIAVVGAPRSDDNGSATGSAYVFNKNEGGENNWGQTAKILPDDAAISVLFGTSVTIWETTILVGAVGNSQNGEVAGSAYVFEQNQGGMNNWGQAVKILPNDGISFDRFGKSVSLFGTTAVVGAWFGSDQGSAYVFEMDTGGTNNWGQVSKLLPDSENSDDLFGVSVSVAEFGVIVGASSGPSIFNQKPGSAFAFEKNAANADNWEQTSKFAPALGTAGQRFGCTVSLSGTTAIVGAYADENNGFESGEAYVYERVEGGGDSWAQTAKLIPDEGQIEINDGFGNSVSVSDTIAIAGAKDDDENGSFSGSAFIFERNKGGTNNWGQVAKLLAGDGLENDRFGHSVSVSGTIAAVGAPFFDNFGSNSGSVYIFEKDTGGTNNWEQIVQLIPEDGGDGDQFGISVSISGTTLVVGADRDDSFSGSAYIFEKNEGGTNNWGQVAKLLPTDANEDDSKSFGNSVSISGENVIVGARSDNENESQSGAAYIFQKDEGGMNNWGEVTKLLAFDGETQNRFGWSVSVSDSKAVVGAYRNDNRRIEAGAAYVFEKNSGGTNNWGPVAKLLAQEVTKDDWFGRSVSVSDTTIIVGATGVNDNGKNSGAAYFFTSSCNPPSLSITVTDETCPGEEDGSITVHAADDSDNSTLSFALNGGIRQASNVFNGLSAGSYDITVFVGSSIPICNTSINNIELQTGEPGVEPCVGTPVCQAPFPAVDESGLNTVITDNTVEFIWNPVEGQIGCEVQVARAIGNPFDNTFFTILGESANSFSINKNLILPGVLHGWRVRCGCSQSPVIAGPFSSYQTFTLPSNILLNSTPNPTSDISHVQFQIDKEAETTLQVIDLNGRMVEQLFSGIAKAEVPYRFDFDGSDLSQGIYIYKLITGNEVVNKKFIISK